MTLDAEVVVPILRSGVLAREFFRRHAHAQVEAVFERSFYLRSGGDFICVGEPDIGNGPLTLIGDVGRVSDLALQPRQSVKVNNRHIAIGHSIRLTLDQSEVWRAPSWPTCPPPVRLIDTCAALERRAAMDAPDEGLARLISGVAETAGRQPPLARIARTRIAVFERWLSGVLDDRHARGTASADAVQGLIGLGPGLTPSGDDFLVGALALLDCVGECDAHAALARAIIAAVPNSTSSLSACFLRAAAAAHVGETLHRAVSSVIAGDAGAAIAAVGTIGHSSGWDMMAGITTALRAVARLRAQARSSLPVFGEGGRPPGRPGGVFMANAIAAALQSKHPHPVAFGDHPPPSGEG